MKRALLIPLIVLCACADSPNLHQEVVDSAAQLGRLKLNQERLGREETFAVEQFSDVLEHPWVQAQSDVHYLSLEMIEDIRSQQRAHKILNEVRAKAGAPVKSFKEESLARMERLRAAQSRLACLNCRFPSHLYNVMNLPEASDTVYKAPVRFEVAKRLYLGKSRRDDAPLYLDVRVFDLSRLEHVVPRQEQMEAIMAWHFNSLRQGTEAFTRFRTGDVTVARGAGDFNLENYSPAGISNTQDRGVFFAAYPRGSQLYVLYCDGPKEDLDAHWETFQQVVNRPLS